MSKAETWLIVSLSARVLAQSAARSGQVVETLDLFADLDTRRAARQSTALPGGLHGFDEAALLSAVEAAAGHCDGLVVGSGLEGNPALLQQLAQRCPLVGNPPQTVWQAKAPQILAAHLERLGVRHPDIAISPPDDAQGWLIKRAGGCGGGHVAPAAARSPGPLDYYQRRLDGPLWSVLLAGDGRDCCVIGMHEQWMANGHQFAGAMVHDELSVPQRLEMQAAAIAIGCALGLRGLNGVDFILHEGAPWVLEVNPRPTATLGLYEDCWPGGMFGLHLDCARGHLPRTLAPVGRVRGQKVVYTREAAQVPASVKWPTWCADLPDAGCVLQPGAPVVTVYAEGDNRVSVRQQLQEQEDWVIRRLKGDHPAQS